ncbi:MAG TPA: hypothetical protein DEQ26_11835 [Flavobacteriaceae bacterium]|nr:hypothetical protein [Flavobacteriaceae bacterium]
MLFLNLKHKKMQSDIYTINDNLQLNLKENHYSFIGPKDESIFENFIKTANQLSNKALFGNVHNVLKDSEATEKALEILGITQKRIYVVIPHPQMIFHSTVEDYCKDYGITL